MAHQMTSFTPTDCTPLAALSVAVLRGRAVVRGQRLGRPLSETAKMLGCPEVWCQRYAALFAGVCKKLITDDMTLLQGEIAVGVRCFDGYLRPAFATPEEITAELLERGALAAKEVV